MVRVHPAVPDNVRIIRPRSSAVVAHRPQPPAGPCAPDISDALYLNDTSPTIGRQP